jgi:ribonuclease HI
MIKINVDGAVAKDQNSGAISAVCQDDRVRFMGCSSIKIEGITNPEVLEAMACSVALSLTTDLQVSHYDWCWIA